MQEINKDNTAKRSKYSKLTINVETTFSLIGICSTEPIYRLSNELNERLKVNFYSDNFISYIHKKSLVPLDFAVFITDDTAMRMRLISNKQDSFFLFDELKQFDYLLQLDGEWEVGELSYLLYCIRNSKHVQYAAGVDVAVLKKKDKIFF